MNIFERRIKTQAGEFHGRVSCDPNDAGYQNYCNLGGRATVMLNGIEDCNCVIADPIEGFVYRAKVEMGGRVVIYNDAVVMETVKGNVQILLSK